MKKVQKPADSYQCVCKTVNPVYGRNSRPGFRMLDWCGEKTNIAQYTEKCIEVRHLSV